MIPKKIAVVAEWLTSRGGAEKVVEALLEIYPKADLFTAVYNSSLFPEFQKRKVKTSILQKIPCLNRKHQWLLPFLPAAISHLDLRGYDLIISSSSAFGKGIRKPVGSIHICYCHTPMRYVWQPDIDERLAKLPFGKYIIRRLKVWDLKTNPGVDYFISNSSYTGERIATYYKRKSLVIYPPVEINPGDKHPLGWSAAKKKESFYFAISRLIPYKRFDLAIKTANELRIPLIVAGSGPEEGNLKKIAGAKVRFVGKISDREKANYYSQARAVIFPGEEDFGIVPIEAMAVGTPVIAYAKGGAAESVIDGETGVLFSEQTVDSLKEAILKLEKLSLKKEKIINNTKRFSKQEFIKKFKAFVKQIKPVNERNKI
ncbi:MAG: glycosyltransferase [Candidatus Berkelbacteria bacterium]|nr:glycosyltransferase [Candidatus Berkelbacteria bacterium]